MIKIIQFVQKCKDNFQYFHSSGRGVKALNENLILFPLQARCLCWLPPPPVSASRGRQGGRPTTPPSASWGSTRPARSSTWSASWTYRPPPSRTIWTTRTMECSNFGKGRDHLIIVRVSQTIKLFSHIHDFFCHVLLRCLECMSDSSPVAQSEHLVSSTRERGFNYPLYH